MTTEEKAERHDIGDIYLFTAQDQDTRLIASHLLGKRSGDYTRRFMMQLASRLNMPKPHASDRHRYFTDGHRTITQISTDGWMAYPEAIDLAFGPYAKFGTIIKEYRNAGMQYDPSEMVGTQRHAKRNMSDDELMTICTSQCDRWIRPDSVGSGDARLQLEDWTGRGRHNLRARRGWAVPVGAPSNLLGNGNLGSWTNASHQWRHQQSDPLAWHGWLRSGPRQGGVAPLEWPARKQTFKIGPKTNLLKAKLSRLDAEVALERAKEK